MPSAWTFWTKKAKACGENRKSVETYGPPYYVIIAKP